MNLVGCDRCPAIFPAAKSHSVLRLFDNVRESLGLEARMEQKELCADCRADLGRWFARPSADAMPPHPDALPAPVPAPAPAADPEPDTVAGKAKRKSPTWQHGRICEICGRRGVQRFVQTSTGWRCAPTAAACPGNKTASDIPAKPFQPNVTPETTPTAPEEAQDGVGDDSPETQEAAANDTYAGAALAHTPPPPGVTARCQDCTRSWDLSGDALTDAVERHELKHSHIVTVLEDATDEAVHA
jgi:hypothetical protein